MGGFIQQKTLGLFVKTNGLLSNIFYGGIGRIFIFHRILPKHKHTSLFGANGMAVSPEYLEWFIQFVRSNGYEFVSLDEACARIKGKAQNKKFAAITIDDGWKDNYTYGLPVFEKHQVPFAIYVTDSFPNGTAQLWPEQLEAYVQQHDKLAYSYNGEEFAFTATDITAKQYAFNTTRRFILQATGLADFKNRIAAVTGGMPAPETDFALDWQTIRMLANHPLCTIGAHTVNHIPLACFSKEEAYTEISNSKTEIEKQTDIEVNHFAYPYGTLAECGQREFAMVEKAGFKSATIALPGNVFRKQKEHLYSIPRFAIGEATGAERLRHILNGVLHFSFNGFKYLIAE